MAERAKTAGCRRLNARRGAADRHHAAVKVRKRRYIASRGSDSLTPEPVACVLTVRAGFRSRQARLLV